MALEEPPSRPLVTSGGALDQGLRLRLVRSLGRMTLTRLILRETSVWLQASPLYSHAIPKELHAACNLFHRPGRIKSQETALGGGRAACPPRGVGAGRGVVTDVRAQEDAASYDCAAKNAVSFLPHTRSVDAWRRHRVRSAPSYSRLRSRRWCPAAFDGGPWLRKLAYWISIWPTLP
jgi:hypothetical protein